MNVYILVVSLIIIIELLALIGDENRVPAEVV